MFFVKNLIILDRTVEAKIFCPEIKDLNIPAIENYKEKNTKFSNFKLELLLI